MFSSLQRVVCRCRPRRPIESLRYSTESAPHSHVPRASRARTFRRTAATVSVLTGVSVSAYTLGAVFPPIPITVLYPRVAPPPIDPLTPEGEAYLEKVEMELQMLPSLQSLRARDDAQLWYESRPYVHFPDERRVHNLTAGVLRGPGRLAVNPLVRARKNESESMVLVHVGRSLCGHDGIIHGGLIATLLDESMARNAINNLPEKVAVTAKLTIGYRAPTMADQFIVIKTKLDEVKGRKALISARVEDLNGTLLAEANSVFVQPQYAKLLNADELKRRLGPPMPSPPPTSGSIVME
ncbi:Thioesterase/thiol ester dehydrase-isomerase [Fistulina hepatica ATCC 64428]|nr:Thioesterase/thiol ester dehydrase-isomerase [Fistulina hepatica ATCC 64428]